MDKPSLVFVRSRAHRNEIDGALVTPSSDFAFATMLQDAGGTNWFLPEYRPADATPGHEALGTELSDNGALTLFLLGAAPAAVAGGAGGAAPRYDDTGFALVLDAGGGGRRVALAATREGDALRLTAQLDGGDLTRVRAALFDTNPNLAIEVTQTVKLATQQSQAFVTAGWSDPVIHAGLIGSFGGIPFSSAAMFYSIVSGADRDYPQQYAVVQAVYRALVPVPPLPGYVQWQVDWSGRAFNYYQDSQDRARVFYLPDRFRLAKGPANAPTVSLLQFSMPDGGTSVERTQATFRYFGEPLVDGDRIQNAAQTLATRIGTVPQMVSIEDAHGVKASLTQYLPNAEATESDPLVQKEASIDLASGLRNEVVMGFKQFRALWAAIFSSKPEQPLFRGWVDVALLDGRFNDRIDFDARLANDREEGYFDSVLDTSTGGTYPAEFVVQTTAKALAGPPEFVEVAALFAGVAATLTAETPKATVKVERSIRDIVLGRQQPDEFPYTLRAVHDDGTVTCGSAVARSDAPNIWILAAQLKGCTAPCN